MNGKLTELLKLCNTPTTIISPIPFFAISIFLLSRHHFSQDDFVILLSGIIVTVLSNFASNLWNHCNDIREDIAQGKNTILTRDPSMQITAIYASIILYIISIAIVYKISLDVQRPVIQYFLIWAAATWCYSDNLIMKRLIGFRLKEHYIGELVTYGIAWPMFTLSTWLIYSDLNYTGEIILTGFFFFSISGLLLKDLKDISGDRKAGLKTLGVVFSPSKLIQCSCYFMLLFYFIILNPVTIIYSNAGLLILIIPFGYFLKNTFIHMHRKNWALGAEDINALRSMGYSSYASLFFLGLSPFF